MIQENVLHQNPTITPSMETTAQAFSISHKKTFKDEFFPLCAELFHKVHLPILVVYPFLMVFFLQVLFVALWPWSPYWNQASNSKIMNWLRTIIFYLPVPHDPILYFYSSLVYFLLNLTVIILIKIQQSYFKYQRKFISFLNYPIRYYFETLMVAMIMPNIVNLGETFTLIAHGQHSATLIIALMFNIINEIFICYSFILLQYLGSVSTFVNISPLLNFDSEFIIRVTYTIRIALFLYFLVNLFENWSYLVVIVIHFALFLQTLLFLVKEVTFENPFVNGSGFGLFFACLISDIVMFVCYFKPNIPILIPLLHSVLIFGTFVILGTIFFIFRMNHIKKKLSVIKENQQEYNNYFDELGLRYNESKVLTYLRVSFIKCCPCFYNLSLINYISEFYESEKAISMCLFFVNFFPKEFRIQSQLEKQLMRIRDLHFVSRFILYQVENLKTVRQFSDNTQARLKLLELKNISRQCEMMTINGLDESKLDKGYFEGLSTKCARTKAVWREALTSNPNNPKFCEEFCRYLIEAECDFPEALKIKNRQLNIELGKSYSVDHGFRSMVAAFPKYLTQGIVDFNGKIIKNDIVVNNQSETSNPNDSSRPQKTEKKSTSSSNEFNDSEGTLDTELEEYLGKNYLKLAKTRLALHRLLENKLPKSVIFIRLLFIILAAYVVVIFSFTFIYSLIKSNNQINNMQQLDYISKSRFYSALSSISIMAQYFKVRGAFSRYLDPLQEIAKNAPEFVPKINFYNNTLRPIVNFTTTAAEMFAALVNAISDSSLKGEDLSEYIQILIQPVSEMYTYSFDPTMTTFMNHLTNASLSSLYSQMFAAQRLWSGKSDAETYYLQYDIDGAELANNFWFVYRDSNYLFSNLSLAQLNKAADLKKTFRYFAFVFPPITLVILYIPPLILHFFIIHSEKKLHLIIKTVDINSKNEARETLILQNKDDGIKFADNTKETAKRISLLILKSFWGLCFFCLILASSLVSIQMTDNLSKLNSWNNFACSRLSLSVESLNTILICIILQDVPGTYPDIYHDYFLDMANIILNKFYEIDENLISGTNESEACKGFDEILDQYNIYDSILDSTTDEPYKYYKNASLHQQIDIYRSYGTKILEDMKNSTEFEVSDVVNILFISDYIMFDRLLLVTERYFELCSLEYTKLWQNFLIITIFVVLCLFSFFITDLYYYHNRVSSYRGGLSIIKRINPYTLLNNKVFNQVFLKENDSENSEKLTIEGSIIKGANEAIFCTNIYGIVEVANNSVSTLLGYTPEQILGQNVTSFFSHEYIEGINMKLDQMRNHQSSLFYEDDYAVVTDASRTIPVHVSILGMKSSSDNVNSFVLIVRNQEFLVQQQRQAEEEKRKSETLLYQILPRDIVYQINRGEKDISFQVQAVSIIFIDINKFSEYAANLTPKDIMSNLSYYFSVLDKTALKYNLLTKIKLIGDIYMAAVGLFNQDLPADEFADQAVLFSSDVLSQLEEINRKLDSNLSVRIGINSGGPIIAGVLGTDKPLFDIIGDPINVAARLQSTCATNHIHISAATHDLIKSKNYEFIDCGETELKGKGKQKTYNVSIPQLIYTATSSIVMK